jgi:pilus assembly protein FimV
MVAKRSSRALALLLVMPSAGFALGLGDIHLLSPLNAPLDAEIELDATPEELGSLKAQIAPRDVFVQHGLDWPAFLGGVQVKTQRGADGRAVIKLKSTDSITEPFITLLVEVDWARGHTIREYTMLLDPPVYTPNQTAVAAAPVAAPSAGSGAREGEISRTPAAAPPPPAAETHAAEPPPAAEPPVASAPAEPNTGASASSASTPRASESPSSESPSVAADETTHLIKRGETLSQIASAAAGAGPSSAQTRSLMLAIYQANPRAFDQNMNLMRSGAVLRMPDSAAVAAVPASQASAEIRRQYAAWRGGSTSESAGGSEPGRLRLVSPTEPGAGAGTDNSEVKALQGRVHDLEGQLSEQKRLVEMRNAELADLQQKLAAKQSAQAPQAATPPAAAPTPPPAQAAPPPAEATPPPAEAAPPPAAQPEAAAPPPAQEPPAAKPTAATPPKPVKRPTPVEPPAGQSSGGILDTLMGYWWALAGIVVLVLAWLGVKALRSRRQSDLDDSLSRLAVAGAESASRGFASGDTPVRPSQAATPREDAFLVEESGAHERPKFHGGSAPAAAAAKHVASDETISSETAINLDQGDPLAEADFHMAYGLYDQAADLIRIAISREPARRDLKLKLLEVFFVWGNKDQFLQTARELAETRDHAAPGEWEKIVIMGKQLAPEDPLFAAGGAISGATAGGVDLNLEGGQSRVDFDLLGEPVPGEAPGGVDLDIGSALGDTGAPAPGTSTDRNTAIDPNFVGSATGTTRQMTQKIGRDEETLADFGMDSEAPTVEQPAISSGDNPTLRQKVEIAMRQNPAEQTAELAIDDLGLDLGALDTMDQPGLGSSPDAPTLVAGMDDHSRRIMEDAQRRARTEDKPSETGTWHMEEGELDEALSANGSGGQDGHDASATSRMKALNSRDVDFDLGDMNGATQRVTNGSGVDLDVGAHGSGVDLDIGTATVPDAAFTSTQKLSSDDLALPDLEPVTMSEVGTKLDLARAYMDMGDPDGARNILEEVLSEGSSTQKQEAQRLMESLPG